MSELQMPAVGRHIRIYTKPYKLAWMNKVRYKPTEGFMSYSERFNPPGTIRLCPANTYLGESVIEWDRIDRIEYLDEQGEDTSATPVESQVDHSTSTEPEVQTWPIEGSKGKTYTVTKRGSQWSCTCVAGGFGKACKHVRQILDEKA